MVRQAVLGFLVAGALLLLLPRQAESEVGYESPSPWQPEPVPPARPSNPFPTGTDCWSVWDAARAAGFTDEQVRVAVAIARAESGCNPNAVCNTCAGVREYSVGAWQLNLRAHPYITEGEARDVYRAAKWAYIISGAGANWTPWTTYTKGTYRAYLT